MLTTASLLNAWRLRWRRALGRELRTPYAEGRLPQWIDRQRRAKFWQMPWPSRGALLFCAVFFVLTPTVGLTFNAQILFAALQIFFAALMCRYASPVFPVAVLSLSILATARYLAWRLTSTLPLSGPEWIWGLLLWLTELLAAVSWILRMVDNHAPLLRVPQALPSAAVSWPTVDVVLWCPRPDHAGDLAALQAQLSAVRAWDWPANKLRLHVLAPTATEQQQARWSQAGAQWHAASELQSMIRRPEWLATLGSELLLVVEGADAMPANALHGGASALMQSLGTAYLCTQRSATAPAAWAAAPLSSDETTPSLMLARRSALLAMAKGQQKWTVAGWVSPGTPVGDEALATREWRVCDVAARPRALAWRLRARAFVQGLSFYAPLAWAVVWITPLLVLGWGWAPVRSDGWTLLAYGLPHGWIASMAWRAQDRQGRLTTARLLREWALQAAVMWRTARAYCKTQLRYAIGALFTRWAPRLPNPALPLWLWARELSMLVLHIAVLLPLLWHTPPGSVWRTSLLGLYVIWALYNLLNTLARLGVAKEAALVEAETRSRARQTAVITLGPGRVLRATTLNFPEPSLRLDWAQAVDTPAPVEPQLTVSVFHKGVAQSFSARYAAWNDQGLTIAIATSDRAEYDAFGAAVFSRDADWPLWLAERHADQLLPNILHRLYKSAESVFYDFVIARRGVQSLLQRLRVWIRPGSPNHG